MDQHIKQSLPTRKVRHRPVGVPCVESGHFLWSAKGNSTSGSNNDDEVALTRVFSAPQGQLPLMFRLVGLFPLCHDSGRQLVAHVPGWSEPTLPLGLPVDLSSHSTEKQPLARIEPAILYQWTMNVRFDDVSSQSLDYGTDAIS